MDIRKPSFRWRLYGNYANSAIPNLRQFLELFVSFVVVFLLSCCRPLRFMANARESAKCAYLWSPESDIEADPESIMGEGAVMDVRRQTPDVRYAE